MRMPFRPPTDYYCELLSPIDEEICALLAKRKEISQDNPGFPQLDSITTVWTQRGYDADHLWNNV